MSASPSQSTCTQIAADVHAGRVTARAVAQDALARIARLDPGLGAFTHVAAERALAQADGIDARRARGEALGPMAGAPFAVKNLFDVDAVTTLAGAKMMETQPPAGADAFLVRKLVAADAVLVGALNMGEFAYDFTGENAHFGPSRNPHDPAHMTGGSSGGSGAAVASGMAALSLGSDTNGSIRVPSSFCGLFGLKPTYGRLSRAGTFPFVASLDHLGPIARAVDDLALAYDVMQGADADDHAQAARPFEPASPALASGLAGLRIATAGGYFASGADPAAYEAVARVAKALEVSRSVDLPEAGRARAAAFLITMSEGAALHLDRLRTNAAAFDPDVRERLMAGALAPGAWATRAHKFRRWYREAVLRVFEHTDVILAPATPCRAPRIGQKMMTLEGKALPVRANLGMFTQPISFIGLPVATVPVWTEGETLPIGVQIIAAPWREDIALRVAKALEDMGAVRAPIAPEPHP
ncbi:MAG: AtzE family amidohydrolase [Hyphomicrobiales bacterium]|nr:AtzE family amidohydrolase [Hyphomicrobiales bacterium]